MICSSEFLIPSGRESPTSSPTNSDPITGHESQMSSPKTSDPNPRICSSEFLIPIPGHKYQTSSSTISDPKHRICSSGFLIPIPGHEYQTSSSTISYPKHRIYSSEFLIQSQDTNLRRCLLQYPIPITGPIQSSSFAIPDPNPVA